MVSKAGKKVRVTSTKKAREDYTRSVKNCYAHWLNTRQAEKQIRCDVCKQIFSDKDIWSHVEIHIGASKQHDNSVVSSHSEQKHQQLEPESSTPEIMIPSSNRNKEDDHASDNLVAEAKSYDCPVCQKRYTRRYSLTVHLKTHSDSGEKPFSCNICEKTFRLRRHVNRHMNVHSDGYPFTCDICTKSFRRKDYMRRHMKIHKGDTRVSSISTSGEKPFTCDICTKSFNLKYHLRDHMCIHTGEKAFKCEICGSSYGQRSALNRHSTIHKAGYPFTCDICTKSFRRKESIRNHIMNIHIGKTLHEPSHPIMLKKISPKV